MSMCVGRGKAAEQMYPDSDGDDSDLLNAIIDDDDEDEDSSDAEAVVEKAAGSDYDSDKDPAWRPSYKSAKRAKVSHAAAECC